MTPDANDPQTYEIIGASMDVHREKGCGFLESVYRECLAIELRARGVPYKYEVPLPVFYKGVRLSTQYRVDFICYGGVLVEVKALAVTGPIEDAQVINYLRASDLQRALLINFGARSLQYKRLVWTKR